MKRNLTRRDTELKRGFFLRGRGMTRTYLFTDWVKTPSREAEGIGGGE